MRRILAAALTALGLVAAASPVAAQTPGPTGYYADGAYYVFDEPTVYWPQNNETAYYRGPYAYAPGFGPYLQLGGEGGWNPYIGSTYNSYPPGDYWSDYAFPYYRVSYYTPPLVRRTYFGLPFGELPYYLPGPVYWR